MDVGASGVRSPEVVQRCKAVPSGVIADDAALVIELAVVVIEPEGLALTRLQSSLDLMREVVAPYPLRRQESLPGGRALRCVVEFPCREVLAAEDQEDGPGEAIEAIRHTLRKRPRALPDRKSTRLNSSH